MTISLRDLRTQVSKRLAGALLASLAFALQPLSILPLSSAFAASPSDIWITSAMANPSGSEAHGEYIVLTNQTAAPISLSGWSIDLGGTPKALAGTIAANGTFKICRDTGAQSTALPCDQEWSGMILPNNNDTTITLKEGTTVIDQVSYDSTSDGVANTFSVHTAAPVPDAELSSTMPTSAVVGTTYDFTTSINETVDTNTMVRVKTTLADPSQAGDFTIEYYDIATNTYKPLMFNASGVAYYGANAGFTLQTASVPMKITFNAPGTYTSMAEIVKASDDSRIGDALTNTVTVTVPDTTAPTLNVTSPVANTSYVDTITESGSASDSGSGVAKVQVLHRESGTAGAFQLDSTLTNSGSSEPFGFSRDETNLTSGTTYDFCFVTVDNDGNGTAVPPTLTDCSGDGTALVQNVTYHQALTPPAAAAQTTQTVLSGDLSTSGDWFYFDDNTNGSTSTGDANHDFVANPDATGNGSNGAVRLNSASGDRWDLASGQYSGMNLRDIASLGFSTYTDHPGKAYLNLDVDFNTAYTGDFLGYQGRLVYVPTVTANTWTDSEAVASDAMWTWSRFDANGGKWPDGNTHRNRSWSDIISNFPDATLNTTIFGFTTSGNLYLRADGASTTYYDNVYLATASNNVKYDFELLKTSVDTLSTDDATPELTGTVSDPTATVHVAVDGVDYLATNNGDGTWTLPDDTVATLAAGTYDVIVHAVAGNGVNTADDGTTNELTITASTPGGGSTGGGTTGGSSTSEVGNGQGGRGNLAGQFGLGDFGFAGGSQNGSSNDDNGEVLGTSTPDQNNGTDQNNDNGGPWKILGLAWYWWLLILAILAALWYAFVLWRRRREEEEA